MELKKNQEIVITIDDLGNNGEGIGHVDGYALFVKDALPGETIRAKVMKCRKNYGFARLLEILPMAGAENGSDGRGVAGVPGATSVGISDVGRVEPKCPVARQCGGCTLQHLAYEKQLAFKEKKVRDCLERIGGVDFGVELSAGSGVSLGVDFGADSGGRDTGLDLRENDEGIEWLPILGMEEPWHYRNKAQFPVRMVKGKDGVSRPAAGFYAGRTHSIIPVTDCAIQDECMKEILQTVLSWMEDEQVPAYDEERHSGIVRHIYIRRGFHTKEIMVCLVVNEKRSRKKWGVSPDALQNGSQNVSASQEVLQNVSPYESLVDRLRGIEGITSILVNCNTEKTNVILGKKTVLLWGRDYIEDCIGDIRYRISPQSFYQVNPVQTEKLYRTVLEFADLSGDETVWDLYCGIGTISLFLAKQAKRVYGVEVVPEAIENARENARLNGIENAEFLCGKAEEVVPEMAEKMEAEGDDGLQGVADVIVVDPPRKGCDGVLLDTMVKMAPEKIVYVSCDPATLARDVKVLGEKGYAVRRVRACDMFPQGGHVESVCLLHRRDS